MGGGLGGGMGDVMGGMGGGGMGDIMAGMAGAGGMGGGMGGMPDMAAMMENPMMQAMMSDPAVRVPGRRCLANLWLRRRHP